MFGILGSKRTYRRKRLPNNTGQRKNIAAFVHQIALNLFQRHVAHGASACIAIPGGRRQRCHTKVAQLYASSVVEHDVSRLNVEVKHPIFVRAGHRRANCIGNVTRFIAGKTAVFYAGEQLRKGNAVDVLHYQVGICAVGFKIVHSYYVWVRKHRRHAGFGKRLAHSALHGRLLLKRLLKLLLHLSLLQRLLWCVIGLVGAITCIFAIDALCGIITKRDALYGNTALQACVPTNKHVAKAARGAHVHNAPATEYHVGWSCALRHHAWWRIQGALWLLLVRLKHRGAFLWVWVAVLQAVQLCAVVRVCGCARVPMCVYM